MQLHVTWCTYFKLLSAQHLLHYPRRAKYIRKNIRWNDPSIFCTFKLLFIMHESLSYTFSWKIKSWNIKTPEKMHKLIWIIHFDFIFYTETESKGGERVNENALLNYMQSKVMMMYLWKNAREQTFCETWKRLQWFLF